jgi:hypothetical protein
MQDSLALKRTPLQPYIEGKTQDLSAIQTLCHLLELHGVSFLQTSDFTQNLMQ